MRFQAVQVLATGEISRDYTYYTESLDQAYIQELVPIVEMPPTNRILLPGAERLFIQWTPDPDGTAVVSFYAWPGESEAPLVSSALLPRGREEHVAILEGPGHARRVRRQLPR